MRVFLALLASAFHLPAQAETVIFADDFEGGATTLRTQWERRLENGGEITISEADKRGKVVCISRDNRNGLTFIVRGLPPLKGSVKVEAEIMAEQVASGSRDFKGGQFHAVVVVSGKEVAWPKSDFDGSFSWKPLSFEVFDLTERNTVILRIGLQQGKGKVCVDDVRVTRID